MDSFAVTDKKTKSNERRNKKQHQALQLRETETICVDIMIYTLVWRQFS